MPRFGKRSKQRLKGVDAKLVNLRNELNGLHFDYNNPKSLASASKRGEVKGYPNFSLVENELIIKP